VVQFPSATDFSIIEEPQAVWPFLESGRTQKTFENIRELGSGGCGTVSLIKHKLDKRLYALKKVKLHTEFGRHQEENPLRQHPAMKEI
jgi:serine/threonine protein kinase